MIIRKFTFKYTSSTIYNKIQNFKYIPIQIIQLSETIQALNYENNRFDSLNLIEDSINAWKQNPSIK